MIHFEDCHSYEPDTVRAAVRGVFDALGGVDALIPAGARVLVKPNFLSAQPPETAVTTHPAVVEAVLEIVRARTDAVTLGDSPGLDDAQTVARAAGMTAFCGRLGVPVVDFKDSVSVKTAEGATFRGLEVAREVLDADVVINLPKLKTHGMMRLTAGVKNMFGGIVKVRKGQWHFRTGRNERMFAAMLVDLYEVFRPAVTIVDGVVGMEGQGPGAGGDPRHVGLLIGGFDAHEIDWVCARLVGFEPESVPTLNVAIEKGLLRPDAIETSRPIEPLRPPFAPPRPGDTQFSVPGALGAFMHRYMTSRPVVLRGKCRRCMQCRDICPAGAISVRGKLPHIDHARCIRCYCCHEICPHGAMELRTGPMLKAYSFLLRMGVLHGARRVWQALRRLCRRARLHRAPRPPENRAGG